jgi:hypothetical protein
MALQKAAHCSPKYTAITSRNTETFSNAAGRTANWRLLLSIKILWFLFGVVIHLQSHNIFSHKNKIYLCHGGSVQVWIEEKYN